MSLVPEPNPMTLPIIASAASSSSQAWSPLQQACNAADGKAVDMEFRRLALRKMTKYSAVVLLACMLSAIAQDVPEESEADWLPSSQWSKQLASLIAVTLEVLFNGTRMLIQSNSPWYHTRNSILKTLIAFWYFDSACLFSIFAGFPWLLDHPISSIILPAVFVLMSSLVEVIIGANVTGLM